MVECGRVIGAILGHRVQRKGATECATKKVIDDLEDCGYGSAKVNMKTGQETAIKDLICQVIQRRHALTVPEHSPVGDSRSNGMIENCCKRLQGMVRTIKGALETNIKTKMTSNHDVYGWIIEWATP